MQEHGLKVLANFDRVGYIVPTEYAGTHTTVRSYLVGSHGHNKFGDVTVEQLSLFEDKYILLNRGISALVKLNLEDAKESLQRYRDIYKDSGAVDSKLKLADFLIQRFGHVPDSGFDEPACLYNLWISFEEYLKSTGMESDKIIPAIKESFFRKIIDSIDRHNLSGSPYLSDTVPMGYVYMQIGLYHRAIESLQKGLLAAPDNAALYGYLGDAYLLKNEKAVARQCYFEACLIDPDMIDWDYMKDAELVALRDQLIETDDTNGSLAIAWLPCHAYLQGLFKPKTIRLKDELKRFVDEYLALRKAYAKQPTLQSEPKIFIRAIVLCDNQAVLKLIKGIDFIEIRRHMKELNPSLFARYMRYMKQKPGV